MQPAIRVPWHTQPIPITTRRGLNRRYTPVFADAMDEWERRCRAEGIPFRETQGGFSNSVSASAGTHGGDSCDLSVSGLTQQQVARLIEIGRELGMAVWFRTTKVGKWGTRAHGFSSYHVHAVPNGWARPSPDARDQVSSTRAGRPAGYRNGRDGLASNQPDLGPGHTAAYRLRTWHQYIPPRTAPTPTPAPQEDTMSAEDVAKLASHVTVEVNRAIERIIGRPGLEAIGEAAGRHTMDGQHVLRDGGLVRVKQEIADTKTLARAIAAKVDLIAAQQGGQPVDVERIIRDALAEQEQTTRSLLESLELSIRGAVVEAQGDVDADHAAAFADAVLDRLHKRLEA